MVAALKMKGPQGAKDASLIEYPARNLDPQTYNHK